WIHLGLSLSFLPVFAFCYAASPFASSDFFRPFILIAPVLALMLGCCTAWMFHRLRRRGGAFLPLVVLLAGNLQAFVQTHQPNDNTERREAAAELADFCRRQGVEVVFVHRWLHWMNAVSGEQMVFCDAQAEPYAPYEKKGNQAERVALLDDIFRLSHFLRASDCAWSVNEFGPYSLMWQFRHTPQPVTPLPEEAYESIRIEGQTNELTHALTDMDCDTAWFTRISSSGAVRQLNITLKEPVALCGIRLWCNKDRYPGICCVEGRAKGEAEWRILLEPMESTPFYWSGTRWYINGLFYRLMYRWPATEPLACLRVSFLPPAEHGYEVDLAELQLLSAPGPETNENTDNELGEILEKLEERSIVRCFADRLLSARLDEASEGRIETIQPSFISRSVHSGERRIVNEYWDISRLTPHDAMLVPAVEAPALERVLERHRINMRQTPVGSFILFDYAPGAYSRESAFYPGLKWIGYGCLSNYRYNRKFKGHYYYREALDSDDGDIRLDYLKEAVSLYPRHKAALRTLADVSHLRGNLPLYQDTLNALEAFAPQLDTSIRFPNGITLLGVTAIQREGHPGEELEMWYYWECPPSVRPADFAVFVHFNSGSGRFQDDHVLLEDVEEQDITDQLTPETFITRRVFQVPEEAPPGDYEMQVGLYNRRTSFRMRPSCRLKTAHKAVVFPFPVHVLDPDSAVVFREPAHSPEETEIQPPVQSNPERQDVPHAP
ncbi:MAG: hypothetical protein PHP44_09840, partial [Kiritimatiellae bacterium]|nr:hypothetical protein [Kiritimatiellia bacterium]